MKLLFVEDDLEFAKQLSTALSHHYVVDIAHDGETAWTFIQTVDYDVMVLDVQIPQLDGVQLCQRMRSHQIKTPVLLLTAKNTQDDKVFGLDSGADDYLVKPVGLKEILARLRALLRRAPTFSSSTLEWGDLKLDLTTHQTTYAGSAIALSPKEFLLLQLFLKRTDWIHKHSAILEQLWTLDEDARGEEAVRAHIKGLRRKLKTVGAADLVETIHGVGYRLNPSYAKTSALLPKSSNQSSTILLVHNQPDLIQPALESCGLDVRSLLHPAELLKTLEVTQPDLVILGADASTIDRLMLCQILRRDRRWNWLPVIVLSTCFEPETLNQIYAAGADDVVHEPAIASELINRILNRLERIQTLRQSFVEVT
jgi:DNA-binding response OmpR family regulator